MTDFERRDAVFQRPFQRALVAALFALAPIALSLLIAAGLIVVVGSDPIAVFTAVWEGAFRTSNAFAGVVNFWIPLTLCGLALVITFTAGLWNIGVEGQVMMGAVFASWAAQTLVLPTPLLVPIELAAAMLGGALWALVCGILKTRLGVNEILSGVALNALANVFSIYLITSVWQPPTGGSAQATAPFPDYALLPPLSPEFPVSGLMLALVGLSIVGIWLALRGTRWGLHLKATGKNPRSALLLGVPTTGSALSAFMVAGALAGLAGAYRVLFTYNSLRPLVSGGIGFLALLVVLLVGVRVLIVPWVGLAFAVILGGSTRLKVALQLDQSLAGVLQGSLVLLAMLFNGVRTWWAERHARPAPVRPAAPENALPPDTEHERTRA
jgi:simple sugar transport system permease protein